MTSAIVASALTGSFSIDRIGDFSRIDARKVRWRTPTGDTVGLVFGASNAFLHYVVDPDRSEALIASEISEEVYALDPITSPPTRVAVELRRYKGDAGMRHLKLVPLDGDVLIYYEQGLVRLGLNGEVRWVADPFRLGSTLDSIDGDVVNLTRPDDKQLMISLNSGRRMVDK